MGLGDPLVMNQAAILILAAGQSRRMRGADKMLELVEGEPLIRRQALRAFATGLPVFVTLPDDRPLRMLALQDLAIVTVTVRDAADGISRSIVAGNAAIPANYGLLLWLADLPEIETEDLNKVLHAAKTAPNAVVRATTDVGKPGHPIFIPPKFRVELAGLTGDIGARDMLRRHSPDTVFVPLLGNRALTDLDTPEEWSAWRANQTE